MRIIFLVLSLTSFGALAASPIEVFTNASNAGKLGASYASACGQNADCVNNQLNYMRKLKALAVNKVITTERLRQCANSYALSNGLPDWKPAYFKCNR